MMIDRRAALRLAVALAHALPRATIELRSNRGTELRASHDPMSGAYLTPCRLRAALLARRCPLWPDDDLPWRVTGITGDGLIDLGGGLYGREGRNGDRHRWFATFLAPTTVTRILDESPIESPAALDASLRPDVELGVVVCTLSTDHPALHPHLDDVARWASAACFTQELLYAAQPEPARDTDDQP